MFHNSDFWLLEIECARGERGGLRIISHSSLLKLLGEAKTMARSFGRICDLEEMECNDKGEGVGHRRWGGDKAIANVERKASAGLLLNAAGSGLRKTKVNFSWRLGLLADSFVGLMPRWFAAGLCRAAAAGLQGSCTWLGCCTL
ncbi:hypothetical protein U1Q18_043675 [Sarracenia purpurea var. burkii]